MVKHLFVINPISGYNAPTDALEREIHNVCAERFLDYTVAFTEYAGHARELVKKAVEANAKLRVYACGGDGTLNEVVCAAAGHDNVAITHYPRGTGNDFIKCYPERDFLNIRALISGAAVDLDCIELGEDRYAINICSVGVDANVAADMKKFNWAIKLGGKMPYNLSLLTNVIKGVGRNYTVEVDGEKYPNAYTMLTACNGQVYGGGFHACPDADPSSGNLEFLLVRKVSRFTIAKIVGEYAAGNYKKLPQYIKHITGKLIHIQTPVPFNVNYDGEIFSSCDITLALSPHKIKFILP
ncbi:MAG: hypothetical protein FWG36_02275 [Oscillospiraceae bacterium]|nr:hypothetical protein [Oscillospiraceae bacterium]